MKAKVLIVSLSLIILSACSKDKYDTKPTLTFENISGSEFAQRQNVIIKLRLTDKEGDFTSDSGSTSYLDQPLYYRRVSLVCTDPDDTIPQMYDIPRFTSRKYLDAHIDVNFTYASQDGPYASIDRSLCATQRDDSLYFQFWVKDAAGNVSDTVKTPTFRLLKE